MKRLAVPIHTLGISQIISFGILFYAFAQIKTPLAVRISAHEIDIMTALSGALMIQAALALIIGHWIDKLGAMRVMATGFMIGALGFVMLAMANSLVWVWISMIPVGLGFAMSSYEVAFSAAVQMDEPKARRNISMITFYGGVASSVTWLTVAPLLTSIGYQVTMLVLAGFLVMMGVRVGILGFAEPKPNDGTTPLESFRWSILSKTEKTAIVALSLSGMIEYLVFAGVSLLLITWFMELFDSARLAVILASLYGPFQVVGRALEMRYGHHMDARITAIIAFLLIPAAFFLMMFSILPLAILSMVLFGMGHGILTVSFGFVTNMYFRAAIYGRAKGLITTPRAFGNALGPFFAGIIFLYGGITFFWVMMVLDLTAALIFMTLLRIAPREGYVQAR